MPCTWDSGDKGGIREERGVQTRAHLARSAETASSCASRPFFCLGRLGPKFVEDLDEGLLPAGVHIRPAGPEGCAPEFTEEFELVARRLVRQVCPRGDELEPYLGVDGSAQGMEYVAALGSVRLGNARRHSAAFSSARRLSTPAEVRRCSAACCCTRRNSWPAAALDSRHCGTQCRSAVFNAGTGLRGTSGGARLRASWMTSARRLPASISRRSAWRSMSLAPRRSARRSMASAARCSAPRSTARRLALCSVIWVARESDERSTVRCATQRPINQRLARRRPTVQRSALHSTAQHSSLSGLGSMLGTAPDGSTIGSVPDSSALTARRSTV